MAETTGVPERHDSTARRRQPLAAHGDPYRLGPPQRLGRDHSRLPDHVDEDSTKALWIDDRPGGERGDLDQPAVRHRDRVDEAGRGHAGEPCHHRCVGGRVPRPFDVGGTDDHTVRGLPHIGVGAAGGVDEPASGEQVAVGEVHDDEITGVDVALDAAVTADLVEPQVVAQGDVVDDAVRAREAAIAARPHHGPVGDVGEAGGREIGRLVAPHRIRRRPGGRRADDDDVEPATAALEHHGGRGRAVARDDHVVLRRAHHAHIESHSAWCP